MVMMERQVIMGPPIDPQADNPIRLIDLAKHYGYKRTTFYSLVYDGRKNQNNQIVKLQTIRMTYGWASSHKAYNEFIALLSGSDVPGKSETGEANWSKRRFMIEAGHAIFRFSAVDLRWILSKMKHDDMLRFDFSKALEELQP